MTSKRYNYVRDMIASLIPGEQRVQTADLIMERLESEGVLHLGYGDAEVDTVIDRFKQAFGTTRTSQQDRWAAGRLIKRHGATAVIGIIGLLSANRDQPYAPVVNNVTQLEIKFVSILAFVRKVVQDEGDRGVIKTG